MPLPNGQFFHSGPIPGSSLRVPNAEFSDSYEVPDIQQGEAVAQANDAGGDRFDISNLRHIF
jgi:hypothetical protein